MSSQDQPSPSCCRSVPSLGGIKAEDFSALDRVAAGLICLDPDFAAPLRQIEERIGRRIATEHEEGSLLIQAAL